MVECFGTRFFRIPPKPFASQHDSSLLNLRFLLLTVNLIKPILAGLFAPKDFELKEKKLS
jgi:hypothetical protein